MTVVAPGGRTTVGAAYRILSAGLNHDFTGDYGTTYATAQVSGLAALMLSRMPSLTAAQIRAIIEDTADDLGAGGRDNTYGHGRINMFRALQYLGGIIPAAQVREWKKERKDPQKLDILLAGDVVIPAGATLRIEAGTVIQFAPEDYAYQETGYDSLPEIIVKGKLEILGTADDHVIFEGHADANPSQPAWYGIRYIKPAVPKTIPNCEFHDAIRALSFSGVGASGNPFTVDDCIVENCSSDGIFIEQSAVTIINSKIRNNGGNGVRVKECLDISKYVGISICSIGNNNESGIKFENVYDVYNGSLNDYEEESPPSATVFGCDIYDNNTGIDIGNGEVKISRCNIRDNSFDGVYSSTTLDLGVNISPNLGGRFDGDSDGDYWGKNNIYGNGMRSLYNASSYGSQYILAVGNYWDVLPSGAIDGNVLFYPIADEPFDNSIEDLDIINDTTWSDEYITIAGDVKVIQGVKLTINERVTLSFASGAKLIVEGILIANGADSNKITFKSNVAGQNWYGIVLKDSNPELLSHLNNCVINDADFAVVCDGAKNVTIENCKIENCSYGIDIEYSTNITLRNNEVDTKNGSAVYCYESSDLTITGNDLTSRHNSGINMLQCHEGVLVEDNEAHHNSEAGIQVSNSEASIIGNNLHHNKYGINLDGSSDCYVVGNNLDNNKYGINLGRSSYCYVGSTLIQGNATGISVYSGGFLYLHGGGDFTSIGDQDRIISNGNGIHIYDDATAYISDYLIAENLGHGIYNPSTGSWVEIYYCGVYRNTSNGIDTSCGNLLFTVGLCDIRDNEVHGIRVDNVSGIPDTSFGLSIWDNTIAENWQDGIHFDSTGIPIDSMGCTISYCNISDNGDDGIEIKDFNVDVYNNGIFKNNNRGVYVTGASVPYFGDEYWPGENDIFDNGTNVTLALCNATPNDFYAGGNYWGTDTPEDVIYHGFDDDNLGWVDVTNPSPNQFRYYVAGEPAPPVGSERIIAGEILINQLFEWDSSYSSRSDGDYCQYSCQLYAGTTYTMTTTNAGGGNTTDTYLYLLDSSGSVVASDDDGNGNLLSKIEYTPNDSGTFYIRLRAYSQGRYGYCDLTLIGSSGGDIGAPTVPGISGSTMITVGSSATYYAYSSDAEGDSIQFEWSTWEGAFTDPNWYSSPAGTGISLTAPFFPGTYTVSCRARDYTGNVSPWVGLVITVQSGDSGDNISVGETLTGQLFEWDSSYSVRSDGDYCQYSCQLSGGMSYVITTTSAGGGTTSDTYLYLLDGSYSVIEYNDDGNGNLLSKIEYTPSYSGTFYIRLRAYSRGRYGYCDLTLEGSGGSGGSISVGETLTYQLFAWQSDYSARSDGAYCEYNCQLNVGTTYVITTTNAIWETTNDTYLYLLDSSYTVVASDDDSNGNLLSRVEYTPSFSGTFYIRLRAFGQGTSGYCDLILDIDSGASGGSISVGETLTYQLFEWQSDYSVRSDGDYCQYSCQLNAGTAYTITTTNAVYVTSNDTYLYLLNSSGSVVASDDDGNGNLLSRIQYTPSSSGTFYIRLRAYGRGTSGYCDLTLTQ